MLDGLVMAVLESAARPLKAHDIARLGSEGGAPLTVTQTYRVLDRLMRAGRVQRIELLSAYLPMGEDFRGFLVCRSCAAVTPFSASALRAVVDERCREAGFLSRRPLFELWGRCAGCAQR